MKLKEIEKEYGVSFNEKKDIELADWLDKRGYNSMAKALRNIENNTHKNN